ncbi:hypothetical protein PIB30_041679 [Stylosanthes scabra]|uniref:Uncharacterized protein n=1 Tax=Stylosanthes scabra TaxID=79078 RepID=A0ABU6TEM8_9FABA|nr:hypothetical protein [Stylosanthes scabra]
MVTFFDNFPNSHILRTNPNPHFVFPIGIGVIDSTTIRYENFEFLAPGIDSGKGGIDSTYADAWNRVHSFAEPGDDDTARGPPDLREQVTLLKRGLSQQAEAHAQKIAVVEAVYAEKVRTLESTVQTQSQEVFELRKTYSK